VKVAATYSIAFKSQSTLQPQLYFGIHNLQHICANVTNTIHIISHLQKYKTRLHYHSLCTDKKKVHKTLLHVYVL